MKHTLPACICLVLAAAAPAGAQVAIDDLAAPTSPAFVLLDVSPAAVERPETPKQFTLNLLSKVATSGGLPENYALEVAPYWLVSHPMLTFAEYQNPGVWQSIAQTFALSVATTPIRGVTAGAEPLGTRLGIGARVSIVNGRANPHVNELVSSLEQVNFKILDALDRASKTKTTPDIADLRMQASELSRQIQAADAERVGFFLTVAGGQAWAYPDDNLENTVTDKGGVWVTPAYRWRGCAAMSECESSLDAIGVVRGLSIPERDTVWDFGGRLVWKATKELNVSFEALGRRDSDDTVEDGSRTVGLVQYRIRQDLILIGSFGRDFTDLTGHKPLVSLLGFNIGFGDKPVVQPVATKP